LRRLKKQSRAARLLAKERPLIIGHRGYSLFAPENTLASFDLAMVAGVDLVELDTHQTKDGILMVIHDSHLNRTTDARRRWKQRVNAVSYRTAAEIHELDAGRWFHPKFAGLQVPTLAQAIDRITKRSVVLIECKSVDAPVLVHLLRQKQVIHKVVVQSFDWAFLHAMHALAPEVALGALGPPKYLVNGRKPRGIFRRLSGAWLKELQKTGASVAVWNHQVSRKAIQLAHAQSLEVWVYTVNTPSRARRLLHSGVDGLITDNPSLIWRTLALMQRRSVRRLT
jgi:glycerophosphoryl diester phosphodiesterase